jgi:hypothetical protein
LLENLTERPILLTLGGGEALRLSPAETVGPLHEVELEASDRISKLVDKGFLRVHEVKDEASKQDEKPTRSAAKAKPTTAEPAE